MDSVVSSASEITISKNIKEKVFSTTLLSVFLEHLPNIKILSLDCFDTILWRKTAAPLDVFYALQQRPAFKALGFTAIMRMHAEKNARNLQAMRTRKTEVTLEDIYLAAFPKLSPDEIGALIEDELAAEIEHCYAFPAIIEIMRRAQQAGLKIIIVSDTYFNEAQLRRLLSALLPPDIFSAIDVIFCSSEYEKSKSRGLFENVLAQFFSYEPHEILHIGDNPLADFVNAKKYQLKALHLLHGDERTAELNRLRAAAASIFIPTLRYQAPLASPFHGVLAATQPTLDQGEQVIGYATLGPIMYAFAQFIFHSIEKLQEAGKRTKILFLMRDAHLPALVCQALMGKPIGQPFHISRFAAVAATFRSQTDIDRYLLGVVFTRRFADISRQLLLPDEISKPLIEQAEQAGDPPDEYARLVQQPHIIKQIINYSIAYFNRLKKYLERTIGLTAGDTLVFVDLGYSGTAQRLLEPIFRAEMNVEIIGRYLISLDTVPSSGHSHQGLLDISWCDDRSMRTLVTYIALLEQLCTSNGKSVLDYDEEGTPIFSNASMSAQQHQQLAPIQQETVRFALAAQAFFQQIGASSLSALKTAAMAELGRLLFLPTSIEMQYLKSFQFDLNLGTQDILQVFDQAEGLASLHKRGLFFSFMEKNSKTIRTNYPAELRAAGIELVLALLAHHRFGFELNVKDLSLQREPINVIITKGTEHSIAAIEALPTYEGYYSLTLPIGNGGFQLGILFGQKYQWLQLDSAEITTVNSLFTNEESLYAVDCWSALIFDKIINRSEKLYECTANTGLIMLALPLIAEEINYALRIVFRPITRQTNSLE